MEIKKIRIHNIASIADAEIDFNVVPLVDADVFLISGKTGSGKSTLLDAICLALYGTTPRLGSIKQNTRNEGDYDITTKDPQNLMRRGTGECFVMLTFVGNDGMEYESTWSAARAHKKADGKPQGKQWELKNNTNGTILTKDREINAEIVKATGLSFDQFCRTTMLAQGDFQKFLKSTDEEKSEILEKITGTDIYNQIGKKIYELYVLRKRDYETVNERISNVDLLSDEMLEEKKNRIADLENKKKEIQQVLDGRMSCLKWMEREKEIIENIKYAEKALENARLHATDESVRTKKQVVSEWDKTVEARLHLMQLRKAVAQVSELSEKIAEKEQNYKQAVSGLAYVKDYLEKSKAQKEKIEKYLDDEKARLSVFENRQSIESSVNGLEDNRRQIVDKQVLIKKLKTDLEKYEKECKNAEITLNTTSETFDKIEQNLKEKKEELEKTGLPELRKGKERLMTLLSKITLAETHLKNYLDEKKRMDDELSEQDKLSKSIENDSELLGRLKVEMEEAKDGKEQAEQTFRKMSDSVEDWAKIARAKLKKGDKCPVCQRTVDEEPHVEEELQALVDEARKRCEMMTAKFSDKEQGFNKLDSKIKSDKESLVQKKKRYDSQLSILENKKRLALDLCIVLGIGSVDEETKNRLDELRSDKNIEKVTIEDRLLVAEELEEQVRKISDEKDSVLKEKGIAEKTMTLLKEKVVQCKNDIKNGLTFIDQWNKDIEKQSGNVQQWIGATLWENDWRINPKGFITELNNAAKKYFDNQNKLETLAGKIALVEAEIEVVDDLLRQVVEKVPAWSGLIISEKNKKEGIREYVSKLLSSVAELQSGMVSVSNERREAEGWLNGFYIKAQMDRERLEVLSTMTDDEVSKYKKYIEEAEKNVTDKKARYNTCQEEYTKHINDRPAIDETVTIGLLKEQIESLRTNQNDVSKEQGSIQQEIDNEIKKRSQIETLVKERDEKKTLYERWNGLKSIFGDSEGKQFRTIAQSFILSNIINSANHYMHSLSDRYELRVRPGSFLIEVVDAYQGFTSRPSSTLSGGEGFLVSLALALALSDVGSRLSSNILFIDEGFGTLSGEPLHNAVDTLKSLHTQTGRHVGIISHIEELRDRIPVQIRVEQTSHNSCSTIRIV